MTLVYFQCIDKARDILDTELTAMAGESYNRAYGVRLIIFMRYKYSTNENLTVVHSFLTCSSVFRKGMQTKPDISLFTKNVFCVNRNKNLYGEIYVLPLIIQLILE